MRDDAEQEYSCVNTNAAEPVIAAADIRDYIDRIADPDMREICRALILDGEDARDIAKKRGTTKRTLLRHVRAALAPLAKTYDIATADKYIDETQRHKGHKAVLDGKSSIFDDFSAGPPGTPIGRPTTGEVVGKSDTLSFPGRTRRKRKKCRK